MRRSRVWEAAPCLGATGNVATEDMVWTFGRMGVPTGVDLDRLLKVGSDGASIPGAQSGGRVRAAVAGSARAQRAVA